MLKVGLVGTGGISGAHIPAWKSMENVELVALCDIRPEQMEKYPEQRHYTDFDEMLENEKLDILDICLPTYLHAECAIKALNKGINVLCEKPISLEIEDIDRVYAAAEKNNVKFMVAQVIRFWPEYEFVREIYNTKKYGRLLSADLSRLGCYPKYSWDGWMMDEKRSGLVPFDLHIHDADFMVYAFGAPKNSISHRAKTETQDYFTVVYEYDDFFVTSNASWFNAPVPFHMSFRLQFDDAVITYEGNKLTIYERSGNVITPGEIKESEMDTGDVVDLPKSNAYADEIRYFADAVLNNKPIEKVTPDSLKTVLKLLKKL
ncbi:MAG: Gfo/Idh/MocA family oxidoreductase [Ruminococcaceae bacterium]|nr:Gfo/Idh/MocA family oxidoreductase [Oscillospiraceae bacterium]